MPSNGAPRKGGGRGGGGQRTVLVRRHHLALELALASRPALRLAAPPVLLLLELDLPGSKGRRAISLSAGPGFGWVRWGSHPPTIWQVVAWHRPPTPGAGQPPAHSRPPPPCPPWPAAGPGHPPPSSRPRWHGASGRQPGPTCRPPSPWAWRRLRAGGGGGGCGHRGWLGECWRCGGRARWQHWRRGWVEHSGWRGGARWGQGWAPLHVCTQGPQPPLLAPLPAEKPTLEVKLVVHGVVSPAVAHGLVGAGRRRDFSGDAARLVARGDVFVCTARAAQHSMRLSMHGALEQVRAPTADGLCCTPQQAQHACGWPWVQRQSACCNRRRAQGVNKTDS